VTRPLEWMAAVRDHPERPPALQRHVLFSLALRMDWQTGCGFASGGQIAGDADCEERTVRRATGWARGAQLLVQTRRGHYISPERKVSSEWRLAIPQGQPDTADLLEGKPTGQQTQPNRTGETSQPDSSTPPSRPRSSRPRSSARGDGANAPRPPLATSPPSLPRLDCPACRRPFPAARCADPDFRAMHAVGEVICSDCTEAAYNCPQCGADMGDWQEGDPDKPSDPGYGLCASCRKASLRLALTTEAVR
jgi:hypothetical protein